MFFLLTSLFWLSQQTSAQEQLYFDSSQQLPAIRFVYPEPAQDAYLTDLKKEYLGAFLPAPNELQTVLKVVQWTHRLWRHNGNNEPSAPDALTIIREAKEGKNFRCVEYAKVATDALLALGIRARVLALKTKDAATRPFGAGHVLTEVWLQNLGKWVLADAQFNLVPLANGVPLNAVELQGAIAARTPVTFVDADSTVDAGRANRYLRFITPYLFFFETAFDHRELPNKERYKHNGYAYLMLVPKGYQQPAVFQQRFPLDYLTPTHSLADFYQPPVADRQVKKSRKQRS